MPDIRENFVSIFRDVAQQITNLDLESAKELLHDKIDHSKVNPDSKKKMKSIINSKSKLFDLMKYVWDALMIYEDPSLKVISEDTTSTEVKLSSDLRLKVAEKLSQVADMLERTKKACSECCQTPGFGTDIPIFIIVQEMPDSRLNFPSESTEMTEMPEFNIQDMPKQDTLERE